jgi:hypothetical protein
MARNNNEVGWNSIQHKDLLNLITTIKKTDPEEFRAIYDAAHKLLDKYTNPEVLSQEIKDVLNGFSNPWRFDHDNNHVIVDGSISGKDLALAEDYGWNTEENKSQKKKREERAKIVQSIKIGSCSSLYMRYVKLEEFYPNIPQRIEYNFDCSNNKLKSLKNGPKYARDYNCANNKLTSLKHISKNVEGDLTCYKNEITTLKGSEITTVVRRLDCSNNKLKNLIGCPQIASSLNVSGNRLVSMRGAPLNLTLRDITLKNNVVSEKSLKLAFNGMKAAGGDYSKGLLKIWKKIPVEDQIHMYMDLPDVTEADIRKYEGVKKYLSLKDLI